jgi:tRNA pseudouridine55 synthase
MFARYEWVFAPLMNLLRTEAVMSQYLDGVLPLDKPAGSTSTDVLNRLKGRLPRGVKLGHAGTLDRFATGVLLALLGRATKRCEELMGAAKTYRGVVKLGATTATLDPDSPEEPGPPDRVPALEELRAAMSRFPGEVRQRPPAFSALKVGGKRASDLVRKGREVELSDRAVRVYRADLLDYAYPMLHVELEVGRGFYVRSFARDLAEALGTRGYLLELRRTRVGEFADSDCTRPDEVTSVNIRSLLR